MARDVLCSSWAPGPEMVGAYIRWAGLRCSPNGLLATTMHPSSQWRLFVVRQWSVCTESFSEPHGAGSCFSCPSGLMYAVMAS